MHYHGITRTLSPIAPAISHWGHSVEWQYAPGCAEERSSRTERVILAVTDAENVLTSAFSTQHGVVGRMARLAEQETDYCGS